ncbi:MAG: hypothetical protein ACD_29C00248G0001 [uncultured bacterium]|nr:MAG: hypothetical protein ACD_29C00248G0001 [uncultured bacterium]
MDALKNIIENAYNNIAQYSINNTPKEITTAVSEIINLLDRGTIRIAEKNNINKWVVNHWIKKAILLFFKIHDNQLIDATYTKFFDKIPLKLTLKDNHIRIVPGAIVRQGAYIGPKTVLMPCFVNIGAYIDSECMIDTWATIGSCAQIGRQVHISGGAGIGGVLEPLQASPTIIEDNCFIGARSEIVEGVIIEKGAVISMGVFIGQSTPIYNRDKDEITYGRIPENAVVISGGIPADNKKYMKYAAIIIKQVDNKTREKTSINDLLREY